MHQCLLHLPHLTRVYEPVKGEAKLGKKSAKRSAALRAVKILHRLGIKMNETTSRKRICYHSSALSGELDEHLRPKKIKLSVDDHGEEDEEDIKGGLLPKAGTKRRKRYYKNQLPNELRLKDNFGDLQGHREAWLYQIVPIMEEEIQDNQKQYAIRRWKQNGTFLNTEAK